MSCRSLLLLLSLCAPLAIAAPKAGKNPPPPPTAPQDIDVDAMARAKDVKSPSEAEPGNTTDTKAPASEGSTDSTGSESAATDDTGTGEPAAGPGSANEPSPTAAPDAAPADAAEATPDEGTAPGKADAGASAPDVAEQKLDDACKAVTTRLLDAVDKADYAAATANFDKSMQVAMPPDKLKEAWESLAQFGAQTARGQSHLGKSKGYVIVVVPLIYEKANLLAEVACSNDGQIAGFHVTPAPKPEF